MKTRNRILGAIGVLFLCAILWVASGDLTKKHYTLNPYSVDTETETVTFEINDNLYDWNYDSTKVTFTTDTLCKVSVFDYETSSPYDDELTKVVIIK